MALDASATPPLSGASLCTYHVLLVGQHGGVDGTGAAEGQVLAHAVLHVGQELLEMGDRDTQESQGEPAPTSADHRHKRV